MKTLLVLIVAILTFASGYAEAAWSVWTEPLIADKVKPDYNPAIKPTSIALKGAKGEWMAFFVVMRADENTSTFVPSVQSTLISGANTIADTNWTEYMVQNVITGNAVTGADTKKYRCILNHTANATNNPVAGATKAMYWIEDTTVTSAVPNWASGTDYWSGSYKGQTSATWPDVTVPYKDRYYGEIRNGTEQGWGKTVPANTTQSFLFEIYIPTDAVAGTYVGTVRIVGQGASTLTQDISVTLTVWNFTLPLNWSYPSLVSQNGYEILSTVMGTRQKANDFFARSLVDHGLWIYAQDSYVQPSYAITTGALNFTTGFADANYGFKRWLDGTVTNNANSPRPYLGIKPKAFDPRSDSGSVFGLERKALDTTTPFSDNGAGGTTVSVASSAHYWSNGDYIYILGSTSYDGYYTIFNKTTKTFDIAHAYVDNLHRGWTTAAVNVTHIRRFIDDWETFMTAQGYIDTKLYGKVHDEPITSMCCTITKVLYDSGMLGGTAGRSHTILFQTIGGQSGCGPWAESCSAITALPYKTASVVSEIMGFVRPGGGTGRPPTFSRSKFNSFVDEKYGTVWLYNANGQMMDYNAYNQATSHTLPSFYIDTLNGARENAAQALSMWTWKVSGFHFWTFNAVSNSIQACGNDLLWDNPSCGDPYRKAQGDGSLYYTGYASNASFKSDIGGTNNIFLESLRLKYFRYGMQIMEYTKLLEASHKTATVDAALKAMVHLGQDGSVWGTPATWESAREGMARVILGIDQGSISAGSGGTVVIGGTGLVTLQ